MKKNIQKLIWIIFFPYSLNQILWKWLDLEDSEVSDSTIIFLFYYFNITLEEGLRKIIFKK